MPAQPATILEEQSTPVIPGKNWEAQRREILTRVFGTLGQPPATRCPLDTQVLSVARDEKFPHVERRHIRFRTEPDEWIYAYLLVPDRVTPATRLPAVVCFHPTSSGEGKNDCVGLLGPDGIMEYPDCQYGLELAAKYSFVTLSIDSRFDGERLEPGERTYESTRFQTKHPQWSPYGKMGWDGSRSVDLLVSLPEVDASRIGAIGHSLGGHCSLITAAVDDRVKVYVSNGGNLSWVCDHRYHWHYGHRKEDNSFWAYIPRSKPFLDDVSIPYPWTFLELASSIAPRPSLTMLSEGEAKMQELPTFITQLKKTYAALGLPNATDSLIYPGGHSFPDAARAKAYALLNAVLR